MVVVLDFGVVVVLDFGVVVVLDFGVVVVLDFGAVGSSLPGASLGAWRKYCGGERQQQPVQLLVVCPLVRPGRCGASLARCRRRRSRRCRSRRCRSRRCRCRRCCSRRSRSRTGLGRRRRGSWRNRRRSGLLGRRGRRSLGRRSRCWRSRCWRSCWWRSFGYCRRRGCGRASRGRTGSARTSRGRAGGAGAGGARGGAGAGSRRRCAGRDRRGCLRFDPMQILHVHAVIPQLAAEHLGQFRFDLFDLRVRSPHHELRILHLGRRDRVDRHVRKNRRHRRVFQRFAHRQHRHRVMWVERHLHLGPAGEIHVENRPAALEQSHEPGDADQDRDGDGGLHERDEIDVHLAEQLVHPEFFEPVLALPNVEHHAGAKHGREQIDDQPHHERHRETPQLLGADDVQDDAGDDRRRMHVDDGGHRAAEAVADDHPHRGPALLFFAHPLVDEHVRVDRHPDAQHQAGQAGQGESGLGHDHQRQHQDKIEDHGAIGHDPGKLVIPEHEQQHRPGRDGHRQKAAADRVLAEFGADVVLAQRLFLQRSGQPAGIEHVDDILDFLLGEVAGDLPAVGDPAANDGCRPERVVEHDGQFVPQAAGGVGQIRLGQIAESRGPFGVQFEFDGAPFLRRAGRGIGEKGPGHVVGIAHDQDLLLAVHRAHHPLPTAGLMNPLAQLDPLGNDFLAVADVVRGVLDVLFGGFDRLGMFGNAAVGDDAEFQSAGGGDLFLDRFDFRLGDVGDRDFDLIFTHRADAHLELAAGVHTPADRVDQVLHVDGAGLVLGLKDQRDAARRGADRRTSS